MMLRFSKFVGIAAVVTMTAAAAGAQQSTPVELGIDATLATTVGSTPNITTVALPAGSFRAGFFVSPAVSIEPRIGVVSTSGGGSTFTLYTGSVGLLYHFTTNPAASRVYVRPFVGITGTSGDGSSENQANVGAGLGVKIPFASRLATRLEANYAHNFSSGLLDSRNQIGIDVGLSFFTR